MPCFPLVNPRRRNQVVGFVCGWEPVYHYEGFLFELHSYFGPIPLRKIDHSPKDHRCIPRAFWAAWERYGKLSEAERGTFHVE